MSTPKQIAANHRNAQKSTGPRTPEGKAKTRLNPLKHGLNAETIVLPFENPDDYLELQQAVLDDLQPKGITQQILVERFVQRHWVAQRLARTERAWLQTLYKAHLAEGTKRAKNPKANPDPYEGLALCMLDVPGDPHDLIHKNFFRYRAQIEHDFERALRALERQHLLVTPSEQEQNEEIGSVPENPVSEYPGSGITAPEPAPTPAAMVNTAFNPPKANEFDKAVPTRDAETAHQIRPVGRAPWPIRASSPHAHVLLKKRTCEDASW